MKAKLLLRSFLALLIGAISVGVLAQQQASQVAPSVERLRQYITYLASDALEGRRTGSPGANDAAHYIAGEFSRLGLRPAVQAARAPRTRGEALSRFLQRFPYVAGLELGKGSEFIAFTGDHASTANLRVGEDWMPVGLSANGRLEKAQAIFVGYSLTVSELHYDDYAKANAAGRIAIAFSGAPDNDNPHSEMARYDDVRWKAIAARNAGAKALVVIASEENFKEDRLYSLSYDNSAGDAGLPVAAISRQAFARVSGMTSSALDEFEGGMKTGAAPLKLGNLSINLTIDVVRREVAASNVIGIIDGADPTLKNEAIVIGAHYDHLGRGGAGSLAPREGEIHHGADDNASGVAGVLELARLFTTQRPRPRRTLVFIAFSGEEEGLLGSKYYVNHPTVPLANTIAMINMDMIGRLKNKNLIVGGVGTAQEWPSMIEAANVLQGMNVTASAGAAQREQHSLPMVVSANGRTVVSSNAAKRFQLTLNQDGYGPSDHSSFYSKQIPVLFFWTGNHEDYHKPSDTADKIKYEEEAGILTFVARIIRDLDAGNKRPTYTVARSDSTGRSTGFRVYLGTVPNYGDSNDGLLLDAVRDDSPAAKAGLKAGDKIVRMAGHEVRNVYDYTYALAEMKAGQEYEVELLRGGERLKFKITPAARR